MISHHSLDVRQASATDSQRANNELISELFVERLSPSTMK